MAHGLSKRNRPGACWVESASSIPKVGPASSSGGSSVAIPGGKASPLKARGARSITRSARWDGTTLSASYIPTIARLFELHNESERSSKDALSSLATRCSSTAYIGPADVAPHYRYKLNVHLTELHLWSAATRRRFSFGPKSTKTPAL